MGPSRTWMLRGPPARMLRSSLPRRMAEKWSLNAVHILLPRIQDYATLHDNKDCADVVTLRILRWGGYPGLCRQAQGVDLKGAL